MVKSKDPVEIAKGMYDQFLTKNDPDAAPREAQRTRKPNPKAQAAGRKGGLVGGAARAATLTPRKRKQIAKKAAQARWKKKD